MDKKFGNKSIYLYTGLIFLVALIIILITFFGQDRILRETNEQIQTATAGITERAAILSEENMKLTEEVTALKTERDALKTERDALEKKKNTYEQFFDCYSLMTSGALPEAKAKFIEIDSSLLSENALKIYNEIKVMADSIPDPSQPEGTDAPSPQPAGQAEK